MTQVAISSFEAEPEESNVPDSFGVDTVGEYFSELGVGSILSGGAEPPSFDGETVVRESSPTGVRPGNADHDIPFLYGVDASHGSPPPEKERKASRLRVRRQPRNENRTAHETTQRSR